MGQARPAERYLARSCEVNSSRNPYPPYFYGTVEDALGKTAVAIGLFEQAIEMDTKPGNPAFPKPCAWPALNSIPEVPGLSGFLRDSGEG